MNRLSLKDIHVRKADIDHTHVDTVSDSKDGLMSKEDKVKVDYINNLTLATSIEDGLMSKEDKFKLDNSGGDIVTNVTPTKDGLMSKEDGAKIANSIISTASSSRSGLMTSSNVTKLNGLSTYSNATTSANGLMSSSDKSKLDSFTQRSLSSSTTSNSTTIIATTNLLQSVFNNYFPNAVDLGTVTSLASVDSSILISRLSTTSSTVDGPYTDFSGAASFYMIQFMESAGNRYQWLFRSQDITPSSQAFMRSFDNNEKSSRVWSTWVQLESGVASGTSGAAPTSIYNIEDIEMDIRKMEIDEILKEVL